MGNFTKVASWIATVHLGGVRSPCKVAQYLGQLVARYHKKAIQDGVTVPPLPLITQGLTQMVESGEGPDYVSDAKSQDASETDSSKSSGSTSASE